MNLVWLLAGMVVGALLVWFFLSRLSDRRVAENEGRIGEQLDRAMADAAEADRAHNETRKRLIDAEMSVKAIEDRLGASERRAAEAQARLEETRAERDEARAAAEKARVAALAGGLAEASRARYATDRDKPREPAVGGTGQESILSAAFLDKGPVAERPAPAGILAAQRAVVVGSTGPQDELHTVDARIRLQKVESRIAMLPAGSSARMALVAERDRLGRAVGDRPRPTAERSSAAAPAEESGPRGAAPSLAASVLAAAGEAARPKASAEETRLKAVEAKLAMLPAGSSARNALLAERDRLRAATGATAEPEPLAKAEPARRWSPPSLVREVLLATPPADREPDDLKLIKGIGRVLEGKLHEFGIYHLEQLAAMTPEEVAKVDAAMDFPGRIERDRWIDQAKAIIASRPG